MLKNETQCLLVDDHRDIGMIDRLKKSSSNEFENAASSEKKQLYEDFSRDVTEYRTLHKFWQLYRTMSGNKG